jgi:hypothetical protein
MYRNRRRAEVRVSDDSKIRDVTTKSHDLHVSVLRADTSQLYVLAVGAKTHQYGLHVGMLYP